ncbi:MAG: hypothetical protein A49_08750 [Methyloceanibacter sp.]|nr:MAG: hypothetical protein A49_08750 [Methyloceanibacter sp.]
MVLMPSFVNLGAYVDSGTMIDTWATVGSCAQIGKNVHLSGGAGIGGVLEPLQANPVIIEDNCFIGARAEVAEGVVVGEGSVLSMGVYIGQSTKIVDRATGFVHQGRVRPIRSSSPVPCQANRCRTDARALALLRGDREDRRRADPVEDLHQRIVARLAQGRTFGMLADFDKTGRLHPLQNLGGRFGLFAAPHFGSKNCVERQWQT